MRKILSVLLMFMFVISFVVAIDDLMTLQGNIKESGVNLASGNISVYIFTTATGGNVIWNSTLNGKDDFNNSICSSSCFNFLILSMLELVNCCIPLVMMLPFNSTYFFKRSSKLPMCLFEFINFNIKKFHIILSHIKDCLDPLYHLFK